MSHDDISSTPDDEFLDAPEDLLGGDVEDVADDELEHTEQPVASDFPTIDEEKGIRLQRYLAACGLGSRRECEQLILDGRITINGTEETVLGTRVSPLTDNVALDGTPLKMERKKYYLLNKPSGVVCTNRDPDGRTRVIDLFPELGPRLFTVGRLDAATTGLIIVTNDGDLAQKLAHPKYRIYRLYKALVAGHPDREIFDTLREGLHFTEGKFRVHSVKPVKKQGQSTWVEVTMTEGQNREIRRLFARVGHKVMRLERIGYGPLRLGRIPIGQHRELSRNELADIHEILQRNMKGGLTPPPAESASDEGDRPRRPARPSREDRPQRGKAGRGKPARGERSGRGAPERGRPGQGRPPKGKPPRGAQSARRDREDYGDQEERIERRPGGAGRSSGTGRPGGRPAGAGRPGGSGRPGGERRPGGAGRPAGAGRPRRDGDEEFSDRRERRPARPGGNRSGAGRPQGQERERGEFGGDRSAGRFNKKPGGGGAKRPAGRNENSKRGGARKPGPSTGRKSGPSAGRKPGGKRPPKR